PHRGAAAPRGPAAGGRRTSRPAPGDAADPGLAAAAAGRQAAARRDQARPPPARPRLTLPPGVSRTSPAPGLRAGAGGPRPGAGPATVGAAGPSPPAAGTAPTAPAAGPLAHVTCARSPSVSG